MEGREKVVKHRLFVAVTCAAALICSWAGTDEPASASAGFEPPVIQVPANIVIECAGPDGAVVFFTVTAAPAEGFELDPVTLECTPPSGSTFPTGETTTVTCRAFYTDFPPDPDFPELGGPVTEASFTVTVNADTTPPVLTVPDDITVDATSSSGAVVTYTSTATDNCDPDPTVSCTPDSGDTFPIGTTTVTCTATDESGNSTTETFLITVLSTAGGGGHTPGFWHNKNGQALIDAADLAALRACNLVQSNGNAFDPNSKNDVKGWINGGSASNMALKLSQHLAAMKLNVLNDFVNLGAVVTCASSVDSSGQITIRRLIEKADAELGLHSTATSGNSWRSYQEALKNALDAANNNSNFVD